MRDSVLATASSPITDFAHGRRGTCVRYSELGIDPRPFRPFASPSTSAQTARATGIGLNWHLNRYVKLMTDYEHTTFRMASSTATPLHNENVLISRIQLGF